MEKYMQQRENFESQGQCLTKINHENLILKRNWMKLVLKHKPQKIFALVGWLFIMDVLKSSAHRVTKHLTLFPYKIRATQELML
jgi:hypothetical protein